MIKRVLLAFQFLTIVPVRIAGAVTEKDIARSAAFFPVAGAFQGAALSLAVLLPAKLFSAESASALLILLLIVTNGGFHLDGLADTFDAIAVKSRGDAAQDREKRLAVMKDSATGAIGVVAIASALLLKYSFITDILSHAKLPVTLLLLFSMPVFSKWIMIPAMYHGVSARKDGLGRIFLDNVKAGTVLSSSLLLALFCLSAAAVFLRGAHSAEIVPLFVILFVLLYAFSLFVVWFSRARFGGVTGDTLGALGEIAELLFLMVGSIWSRHFI